MLFTAYTHFYTAYWTPLLASLLAMLAIRQANVINRSCLDRGYDLPP